MNDILTKDQITSALDEIAKQRSEGVPEEQFTESLKYLRQETLKLEFDTLAKRSYKEKSNGVTGILPIPRTIYTPLGEPISNVVLQTEPIGYFISRLPIDQEAKDLELKELQEDIKPYIGDEITDALIESLKDSLTLKMEDIEDRYKLTILENFQIYIEPDEVLRIYLQPV